MIYADTSVFLASLWAENRRPPAGFWDQTIYSSRLLEYEAWCRIHSANRAGSYGEAARVILGRVRMLELVPSVVDRALDPFPVPVRTLDALHLASACFLKDREPSTKIATYDRVMAKAGRALGFEVVEP